ncbi:hypothetical protein MTR67_053333 [Solanum verrucosum]|uniref:Integrase zinc-binding domain-containing protein n=1 Tax=Solanum verrucosum TaxID=315347 RepID=A0AAF0V6R6_SOLVR|nr:hypothetical protein MTR67_053333 [Solanum verrucosum]
MWMKSKKRSWRKLIAPDTLCTKMYRDLREIYWWSSLKWCIAEFVVKCLNCQQVKVEHQRPGGMAKNIDLLDWKWEMINMDFITGLPQSCRQHGPPNSLSAESYVYLEEFDNGDDEDYDYAITTFLKRGNDDYNYALATSISLEGDVDDGDYDYDYDTAA